LSDKPNRFDTSKRPAYKEHYEKLALRREKNEKRKRRVAKRKGPGPDSQQRERNTNATLPDNPVDVMGVDVERFVKLLQAKRGDDELYNIVDELQFKMVMANLGVIEKISSDVNQGIAISTQEKIRIISAIKTATAAVNDTLKALGISKISRDEDPAEEDDALKELVKQSIGGNVPPALQEEYLTAIRDISEVSGNETEEEVREKRELVHNLRVPLNSFNSEKKEIDDVDVESVGIKELK
jgi:hypothetical protein